MNSIIPVTELIVDAWPVLEWLKGREPCTWLFRALIDDAVCGRTLLSMSRINYGEVVYSIRKSFDPGNVEQALKAFSEIPFLVHSIGDSLLGAAVDLKARYTIPYADAFAAAYAMRRDLPLVTGDRDFLPLVAIGLQLHWVGA